MGDRSDADRLTCTCMALSARDLLDKWLVRFARTARRRSLRGKGIDPKRAADVAIMVTQMEKGPDVCPQAWADPLASCHLPGCPWRRRQC